MNKNYWEIPDNKLALEIKNLNKFYYGNTKKICENVIKTSGASSMKDMGKIMGILKKDHGDVLDFSKVSKIIKDLLNK